MHITYALLVTLSACKEHRQLFSDTFPNGIDVTGTPAPETIELIVSSGLSVAWLAEHVLTATAYAEYDRVRAPAYAEYDRVRATASAEYDRVRATAYAEYDRVTATASAEYDRVMATELWRMLADPKNIRPL